MNEILLRRKGLLLFEEDKITKASGKENALFVATLLKNLETLGYTLAKEVYDKLILYDTEYLKVLGQNLISMVKLLVGADVTYRPLYPGFPNEVIESSSAALYINAMMHYWSFGTLYPTSKSQHRQPLLDTTKLTILKLGTEQDLQEIFLDLVQAKSSLSKTDKEDLHWFFCNRQSYYKLLPENIPFKETAVFVVKEYIDSSPLASVSEISNYIKSATDVLRLCALYSGEDVSLSRPPFFKSFKRRERRFFLALLNECSSIEEDMKRHKEYWIRLGERLHPGEFKKGSYQRAVKAFDRLRNEKKLGKIKTFYSLLEKAIGEKDLPNLLLLLKARPGEFARKLDYILRNIQDTDPVLSAFREAASQVSTPVLLQALAHFRQRISNPQEIRVFFPKGNLSNAHCLENRLKSIPENVCETVTAICEEALIQQYSIREPLGKVYLSHEMKQYLVPFSQRNASKAYKTIVRGSHLKIDEDAAAVRGFIWWTNQPNKAVLPKGELSRIANQTNAVFSEELRVDLDLSAAIFDKDWNFMEHISFTRLRSNKIKVYHSGDIVNGGPADKEGVSEFIDVDLCSVLKEEGRYVVFQVYSYTRQPFGELSHCMFGFMERNDVNSGEIYEPSTVRQRMDLTCQSTVSIPVIIDCLTREIIWCDMALNLMAAKTNHGGNTLESNLTGVALTCYGMVHMAKPSLYDLYDLNIRARGERTDNKDEADILFDTEDGIRPWDTEVILSQYL